MRPIWRLLNPFYDSGSDWGPAERAGLRSAFLNRQWPQARLHQAGLAASPGCRFCAAVVSDSPGSAGPASESAPAGTLAHRLWGCPVTEAQRVALVAPELLCQARRLLELGELSTAKWLRALVPLPRHLVPPPPAESTFAWVQRPPDNSFRQVAILRRCYHGIEPARGKSRVRQPM